MRTRSGWPMFLLFVLLALPSGALANCLSPNWLDQYHSLRTFSVDDCPSADLHKPLFTRIGTLVCPTRDSFMLAYNARSHDWHFVDSAGIPRPVGASSGMPVSPAYFSCSVYGDGTAIQLLEDAFGEVQTNIGWLALNDLRNSDADVERTNNEARARNAERSRPRLCYPDIPRYGMKRGHCYYTDVKPYALVP